MNQQAECFPSAGSWATSRGGWVGQGAGGGGGGWWGGDRQWGELDIQMMQAWKGALVGFGGPRRQGRTRMPMLPGSLCPLCNHCACWHLFPRPLNVLRLVPTGSKTREGVVQGVASGTSPALPTFSLTLAQGLLTSREWGQRVAGEGTPRAFCGL